MRIVVVKGLAAETCWEFEVPEDASTRLLKEELRRAGGFPLEQQRLAWRDKAGLEEERRLSSYEAGSDRIGPGSRLTLVLLSPYAIAKRKHAIVGKVLAAMAAGVFIPESAVADPFQWIRWDPARAPEVPDEEFDALVHNSCGGAGKPDSTYTRFVQYLGFWFNELENRGYLWERFAYTGGPVRTIRHALYAEVIRQAAVSTPSTIPLPFLCPLGTVVHSEIATSDQEASPFLLMKHDLEMHGMDFRATSECRDSRTMAELLRSMTLARTDHLADAPAFVLQEREVLLLLHAQAQLTAGVCPVLLDGELGDEAAALLARANGLRHELAQGGHLDWERIAMRPGGLGYFEAGLVFVLVEELPEDGGGEQVSAYLRALREASREPLNFVLARKKARRGAAGDSASAPGSP